MDKTLNNLLTAEQDAAEVTEKARTEAARIAEEVQIKIREMQNNTEKKRSEAQNAMHEDLTRKIKDKEKESEQNIAEATARIQKQLQTTKDKAAQSLIEELL